MSEVKSRVNNPTPELLFQEIYLPDARDFGTGAFRFQVKRDALIPPAVPKPRAIIAIALNPPHFQVSVSVNPGTREVPVLLGRADGSDPTARAVFVLPPDLDTSLPHEFKATFQDWQVISLTMDDVALPQR